MGTKTLAIAATFALSLGGAALAQAPAGGGSSEGNLNNPGSVKSNSEKMDERTSGSPTSATGSSTGSTMAPGADVGAGGAGAAPTGGHSSGGGTSTGGMAR